MSKKNQKEQDNSEASFKIITMGNSGVGKSSIIKRFISGKFETKTISTIGFGSFNKEITLKNGTKIKLNIIDTAGQENYKCLSASYIKNADGVLFVFAFNEKKTFEDISGWITNFKENSKVDFSEKLPAYLVGNKCDLDLVIDKEDIEKLKTEHKFFGYIETSAKEGNNINEVFQNMGEMFIQIYGKRKNKQNVKLAAKHKKKGNCQMCKGDL